MIYTPLDEPRRSGSCGKLLGPYDARIVDERGFELPSGEVGELVIRPLEPNVMMEGYFGMPSESLIAFRNLWFHTGDLLKRDSDGFFYFVGRRKEVVRRRGENISSVEVERVINEHPDIVESCVFGVPSELSEEEVMACVVTRSGVTPDVLSLHQFCVRRLAKFMVPRYFRVVEQFPKTPTDKIEKHLVQEEGITPDTWDATSADGGRAIDRARLQ
jgi:crotonobetaine/carnitine-CoA ligase